MWPFKKRKSSADRAIEALPHAIDVAAQKWIDFQFLKFKDEVPLQMRIGSFLAPLQQGLKQWDAFKDAPDAVFLLIACKGIEKSGTHSKEEIEDAIGITLPA